MRLPIPVSWDVRPPIPSPIIASMKMFFPPGRRHKTPVEIKKPTYPILLVTMNRHSVLLLGTESGPYAILAPLVQLRLMRIGADKSALGTVNRPLHCPDGWLIANNQFIHPTQ